MWNWHRGFLEHETWWRWWKEAGDITYYSLLLMEIVCISWKCLFKKILRILHEQGLLIYMLIRPVYGSWEQSKFSLCSAIEGCISFKMFALFYLIY